MVLQTEQENSHSKLKPYQKWLCLALMASSMLLTACGKDEGKKSSPLPTFAPYIDQFSGQLGPDKPHIVDKGDVANPGKSGK